jgi:uncharacterized protein YbjQ (UPF0145 family)
MKIDLVFLIVLGIVVAYIFILHKVETMADVGNLGQIKEAVKQVYLADVEAIRNLSNVASQLQANGLTVPGNLKTNIISSTDNISVTNKTNEGGRLRILNELKSGKADQTNDWSIWNMTGGYGNKLSFWRYNGDGKNAGPALDLMDDGTVSIPGNLKVGSTVITENLLKRIINQQNYAGFAVDGDGTTMPLYEGTNKLFGGDKFDAWTNDRWDVIYINRGWKITLWHHDIGNSKAAEGENKTSNVPIKLDIPRNTVSSYKAEWIGY